MANPLTNTDVPELAASIASRLAELVGAEHVITDGAQRDTYRVDEMLPSAALLPGSAEEVARILRFAASEGLALIPMSGRTKIDIGMPPERYDLALDLSRMNRVLAYDPRDLTLGVEPAVRFADLYSQLQQQRQFLPLGPAFAGGATLGGIAAAGADSPWRYGYGSSRDYLLGMEFVTGDGVSSKSGGRVVKNVTGYDLHKLLIGSLGTLAVITRLNFRTFPLPSEESAFVASFDNVEKALHLCAAIAKSPLQPKALEVLDRGMADLLAPRSDSSLLHDRWSVLIAAAGHGGIVQRYARDLAQAAEETLATGFCAPPEEEQATLLPCVSDFQDRLLAAARSSAIFRIPSMPSVIPTILQKIHEIAERHSLGRATLIRAASVVYAALCPASSSDGDRTALSGDRGNDIDRAHARVTLACRELMDWGVRNGTGLMIERCPFAVKHALKKENQSIWPRPSAEHMLARSIKQVFDPRRVLAPGRFYGGI